MKVKIGNKIYDSEDEPIMVILTDKEKDQISRMPKNAMKFCSYPNNDEFTATDFRRIQKWMGEV
jgi:hypothetical protein